jgi:hypothetical protein
MRHFAPQDVALRHLARLATELRRTGLTAAVEPDRHPFPGVLATDPAASAVIMAGTGHYWRRADDDLVLVGVLTEPADAASIVHKWLTGRKARR